MTVNNDEIIETLIRYMDGELDAAETATVKDLLQRDAGLQQRYENLVAAKRAIRSAGLKQKINTLHKQYYPGIAASTPVQTGNTKRIKGISYITRIAAVFVLMVLGYGIYQYTITSNDQLFADSFLDYQLPVNRGAAETGPVDSLYRLNDFKGVIAAVSEKAVKTQQDYFLSGQANLQNNDAKAAINDFKNLEAMNTGTTGYYVQETDYYLALAYLKDGNIADAKVQLEKILSNSHHLFYSKAKDISKVKLAILEWKN